MLKILIIDYGMCNLFSVQRALKYLGYESIISSNINDIESTDKIILPGVGAFGKAMAELERLNILYPLIETVKAGKPILGICLGMQLFFSESSEYGNYKGMNLIKGNVERFTISESELNVIKIPHIGWNSIHKSKINSWDETILKGLKDNSEFYFVHSFICLPQDTANILATSKYGHDNFCSVVLKGNIMGCQFHPEKSGNQGLLIYKNFLELNWR